jgi:hypothetical protein
MTDEKLKTFIEKFDDDGNGSFDEVMHGFCASRR